MSDYAALKTRYGDRERARAGGSASSRAPGGAPGGAFGDIGAPGADAFRGAHRARGSAGAERTIVVLLAAAAILAFVTTAALVLPSALRITRYDISGNASISREELLSAAPIHDKEYYFSVDADRVKAALEAEPRIARAEVRKLFPNGLRIAVQERKAVASALAVIDGREATVCLDAEGVAFAEASAAEASAVPAVSGIRFEGFRPGMRLPPVVARLLSSLGGIGSTDPALLSAISEIRIVAPDARSGGEPELLIYPLHYRIPVRAGASLDAPTLRSMILVLDVLGTRGIADTVQELDFRSGRAVYRSKEGQSG